MPCTDAQKQIVQEFQAQINSEVELCLAAAARAKAAIVSLPAQNERGESVLDKDNNRIRYIFDYWKRRAQRVWYLVPFHEREALEKRYGISF